MSIDRIRRHSSQQTSATGIEVDHSSDKGGVEITMTRVCQQCNSCQSEAEQPSSPPTLASTLKRMFPTCRPFPRDISMAGYRRHPLFYGILFVTIIAIIIAIVVPTSIKLRPRSPTGLYRNGTGLVALDRGDESSVVDIFFQHASGQIRHIVLDDTAKQNNQPKPQQWTGGRSEDNILGPYAPPPRRGTPLMAVSYKIGNETTWRVIYIDSSDFLQESIASTKTSEFPTNWLPGPLGLGQFKANSSLHTGLSVCQHMLWSPDALGFNNGSLVLFYGGEDGMNHMLTHEIQDTAWNDNHTFKDSSADSGIECTSRRHQITDVWMINSEGHLLQASFNFDHGTNSSGYRAGEWTSGVVYKKEIQIPTPITAIKYTGSTKRYKTNSTFVHFVARDDIVNGINVDTYDRSHGPMVTEGSWEVSASSDVSESKIVSGSKIASIALKTSTQDEATQEHGENSKIIVQFKKKPKQISIMSRNFWEDASSFAIEAGDESDIKD